MDKTTEMEGKYKVYGIPFANERFKIADMDGFWIPVILGGRYDHGMKFTEDMLLLDIRHDDVITCGFPKSGITWLNEIIYLIMNDVNIVKARGERQETRVPFMEYPIPGHEKLKEYPSPRIMKTHMPLQWMPKQVMEKGAKVIYIIRNPKDVSVSLFHFQKFMTSISFTGTMENIVDDFEQGTVIYGPYWKHIAEFYNNRERENLLIVFYEHILKNPAAEMNKMASFLGKKLDEHQLKTLVETCAFESMKSNDSVNFSHLVQRGHMSENTGDSRVGLMRKGVAGDWKNYYTGDMEERINKKMSSEVEPLGLKYCDTTNTWLQL